MVFNFKKCCYDNTKHINLMFGESRLRLLRHFGRKNILHARTLETIFQKQLQQYNFRQFQIEF